MTSLVELKQIKLVLTLARHRHFGRAAIELGLSQSALSKNLQAFEHEIGASIFDRGAGDVTLTSFGEAIVTGGAEVLEDVEQLQVQLDRVRGLDVGRVRFGVGNAHTEDPVGTALGSYVDAHPGVSVEPVVGRFQELLRQLQLAEIQFCVVTLPHEESAAGLKVVKLAPRRIVIYCRAGHPLAGDAPVDASRILDFRLISLPHLPLGRRLYKEAAGPRAQPTIEIADCGMIRAVLRSSDAVAVGLRSTLSSGGPPKDLVVVPVKGNPFETFGGPCGAIVSRLDRVPSPASDGLIAAILEADAKVAHTNPEWVADREAESLIGTAAL